MFSESHPSFRSRLLFFYGIVIVVFTLLFFRYWYLQVPQGNAYYQAATQNTLREVTIPALRGRVFSKDGVVIADYKVAYDLMLDRNRLKSGRLKKIAPFLGLTVPELQSRLRQYRTIPLYKPVPVLENLDFKQMCWFNARKKEFPEILVEIAPQRFYPFHDLFAHSVGYIGEPTVAEARKLTTLQKVGKSGVERYYDNILRGRDGSRRIVVDAGNRFIKTQLLEKPRHGKDIVLSLIQPLQKMASDALGKYQGAVIVMNARDGRLYAMVSSPSYDPNILTFRFKRDQWQFIKSARGDPMLNRATQGRYPPGSIFKPLVAMAGLSSGLRPSTRFTCTGSLEVSGRPFLCWNEAGHGSLNLTEAIAHSCNVYFYNVGLKIGIDNILKTARLFRIGKPTGIDIPGEVSGLLPSPEWKRARTGNPWYPGDTLNTCIGQGYLLVTPIQVASFISTVANGGDLLVPHLLDDVNEKWHEGKIDLPAAYFRAVRRGMRSMVTVGTGVALNDLGMHIAGKTGTAQTRTGADRKGLELSWFAGFTPVDNPAITVVIIAEKGGHGSDTAVPIANQLFQFYRDNKELFK